MGRIAIVTDSAAAITPEELKERQKRGGFAVVPMPVAIQEATVRAGIRGPRTETNTRDVTGLGLEEMDEAILMAHVLGNTVNTSGPAPGVFADTYDALVDEGYEHILSIHLSGELSGTVEAARVGAQLSKARVTVLDSRTIAGAYGHAALHAHKVADTCDTPEELAEIVTSICAATDIYFYIPTLDALRRGGRVSPALAMVGQMFQIKPIGTVADGKLTYVERPRTATRAKERLTQIIREACAKHRSVKKPPADAAAKHGVRPTGHVVALYHMGNLAEAKTLQESLGAYALDAALSPLPPVLAAHSGPGALAAIVY